MIRSWLRLAALVPLCLAACGREPATFEAQTRGNPAEGGRLMHQFGCPACHRIPGVGRADGLVGPSLAGLRERVYLGGVVPNTADNLVTWIQNPRALSPKTAMPNVGASAEQARHMAAYLYSL